MEAHFTNSTLTIVTNTVTNTEVHEAWHLLALLLRIGRPVRPAELASRCILFQAPTDYVEYLCSIPNSPICLTNNLFVTPSRVASVAFRKFESNSNAIDAFVPRIVLGDSQPRRIWEYAVRTYYRRRKRIESESEAMPVAKKRAVLHSVDDCHQICNDIYPVWFLESEFGLRITRFSILADEQITIVDCCLNLSIIQVRFPNGDYINRGFDIQTVDNSITKLELDNLSRAVWKAPLCVKLNAGLLSYGMNIIDLESSKETSILEHMGEHRYTYSLEYEHSFLNFKRYPHILHPTTVQGVKACMPHGLHPVRYIPTNPIENSFAWRETKIGEISSRIRTIFNATSCPDVEEQSIPEENENVGLAFVAKNGSTVEDEIVVNNKEEELSIDSVFHEGEIDYPVPSLDIETTTAVVESKAILSAAELSVCQKQLMKSSAKSKTSQKEALNPKLQALCKMLGNSKDAGSPMEQLECTREKNSISARQKLKKNCDQKIHTKKGVEDFKEKREKLIAITLNVSFNSATSVSLVHD
ncbi:non-specific serine,threonine protein kinase [Sarracenia purpurea var. burkii]